MGSESTFRVLYSIQLGVILPINLIGNILVCLVMITIPQLRTPMNCLLVNLAISDILVALFQSTDLLFWYGVSHPTGVAGDYLCKFLTGKLLVWMGSVSSVFSLVAVAFERYYAIVHPLRNRGKFSRKILNWILLICWLLSFLFNIPLVIVRYYNKNNKETGYVCISKWPNMSLAVAYNVAWLVFIGIIPIITMSFLYGKIAKALWRPSTVLNAESTARLKAKKRVTKMLIFLTVFYAICWMPNLVLNVVMYYYTSTEVVSYGYFITELLVLVNSSINPFVYSIQSHQFWNGIKTILSCRRRVYPQQSQATNPSHQRVETTF